VQAAARQRAEDALKRIEQTVRENPWLVGALTIATGVIIGMALPKTAQEREFFSHVRTALAQQLHDLTHDTLGTLLGKNVAHPATPPPPEPPAPPPAF
jgi:hypothetical protein